MKKTLQIKFVVTMAMFTCTICFNRTELIRINESECSVYMNTK